MLIVTVTRFHPREVEVAAVKAVRHFRESICRRLRRSSGFTANPHARSYSATGSEVGRTRLLKWRGRFGIVRVDFFIRNEGTQSDPIAKLYAPARRQRLDQRPC